MKATRTASTAATVSEDFVLAQVLVFIGTRDWLFAGGSVCKKWTSVYLHSAIGGTRCTHYGAAVTTLARLQLAVSSGLKLDAHCVIRDQRVFSVCHAAGRHASREALLWAREHGLPWHEHIAVGAIQGGRLGLLAWLRDEHCCPWTPRVLAQAALLSADADGDGPRDGGAAAVAALDWLWARAADGRWERGGGVCRRAAQRGHVRALAWMKAHGCLWDEGLVAAAAGSGQRAALEWLRNEGGCEWSEATLSAAAIGGHYELVLWLKDQGCPWPSETMALDAALGGSVPLLTWLQARGEGGSWSRDALGAMLWRACFMNHLAAAKWLRDQGAPWPSSLLKVQKQGAACWRLSVLQWAISNGCPWSNWSSAACATLQALPFMGLDYSAEGSQEAQTTHKCQWYSGVQLIAQIASRSAELWSTISPFVHSSVK
ncbi:hypothetical protein JKP88DRAFT_245008 [Tribonema minus]|uniref:Ankyrin repeat domain-containing protein n=1 Tax=Tribonema minus TaxID=303371 RepID=A0A835Z6F8_9STRA|nr:hypothetical protein JKP88DRAFT_245008 [Tribonema minus]